MSSPENCAALLKMYLSEEVKCAKGQNNEDQNWELHPHSFFYSVEGEYNRNEFTKSNKQKETQIKFEKMDNEVKEICLWNLGSQMEVDMSNGKRVECRNTDLCTRIHKTVQKTTKKEAKTIIDKMNNGKLKISFESKFNSAANFKKIIKKTK